MNRPANYNTKQREAVLAYIASIDDHVTAIQVVEHFKNQDITIGRTTIYRHLEQLTKSGKVRRYTIDGITGACYQYLACADNPKTHLHLKCEDCGELLHMDCDMMNEIKHHIFDEHEFQINFMKTVFYGKCSYCLQDD